MARIYVKPVYENYLHKNKIWFAGEVAERQQYVCRHCNSCTAVAPGSVLPLCPNCNGRRFTPL